jgi:hypothetical protein
MFDNPIGRDLVDNDNALVAGDQIADDGFGETQIAIQGRLE